MSTVESSKFPTKSYNLQKYKISAVLYNADNQKFVLNPESILQLVIEDDILFWPTKGFLVYESPHEIMERNLMSENAIKNSEMSSEMKQILLDTKPYMFRNDGKDCLKLTIKPLLDDEHGGTNLTIQELPDEQWLLDFEFVIYDRDDMESNSNAQKAKKLYFWDKTFHDMITKNVDWSTAKSDLNSVIRSKAQNYYPSQATDADRSMYTGDAIRSLLETGGFDVDTAMFDKGSTKILYNTYADTNLWEDIEYILAQHMSEKSSGTTNSEETDLCIFTQDRFTKKFQLIPIKSLFKKAGNQVDNPLELQTEHLFFEDVGNGENVPPAWKAPLLDELDAKIDVKMAKIKSYQFVDMSAYDNSSQIVTIPVITYDSVGKTFSVNTSESNVEKLKKYMEEVYIKENFLSVHGYHPILTLNKDKKENKKVNPIYCIRSNKAAIRQKGIGQLMYDSLFLNGQLHLQLEGATIRRCGTFLGVDRKSFSDNTFDYKLCGQWFVTKSKHIFYQNKYINELFAVKIHSYDSLLIDNDAGDVEPPAE